MKRKRRFSTRCSNFGLIVFSFAAFFQSVCEKACAQSSGTVSKRDLVLRAIADYESNLKALEGGRAWARASLQRGTIPVLSFFGRTTKLEWNLFRHSPDLVDKDLRADFAKFHESNQRAKNWYRAELEKARARLVELDATATAEPATGLDGGAGVVDFSPGSPTPPKEKSPELWVASKSGGAILAEREGKTRALYKGERLQPGDLLNVPKSAVVAFDTTYGSSIKFRGSAGQWFWEGAMKVRYVGVSKPEYKW